MARKKEPDAIIRAFFGASGCGKSTAMLGAWKQDGGQSLPVFIWSPKEHKDRYHAKLKLPLVRTPSGMVSAAKKGRGFVFFPSMDEEKDQAAFAIFCKTAKMFAPCSAYVDEVHTVTKSNKAPRDWHLLVSMERASGVRIYAGSQRPVGVDKSFIGNLSSVWSGRLNFADDVKAVANMLNVPSREVSALFGFASITRDMYTGETVKG